MNITTAEILAALAEDSFQGPVVEAGDSLAEAGRKTWRYQFNEMLLHEAGTRLGENIEELHEMRVASRRMRAAFDVFGPGFKTKVTRKRLRGLQRTGRTLGQVRDLDVFMEKVQLYLEHLPVEARSGLELLLQGWQARREQARLEMLTYLDSKRYARFKDDFFCFVTTPGLDTLPPDSKHAPGRVCELAPVLIYSHLGAVRAHDAHLNTASYAELHALRIEFKKLRYAVEFFRPALGETSKEVINDLKRIQDHLGELNDAHIAIQIVEDFLHDLEQEQVNTPLDQRRSVEGVLSYLADRYAERHRLVTSFPDEWQYFNRVEFRSNLARAVAAL